MAAAPNSKHRGLASSEKPTSSLEPVSEQVRAYLAILAASGFTGDVAADRASRLVSATDNSIYQIAPQAILFPRSGEDMAEIIRVANQPEFKSLRFYARGGGTSMNGQPLGSGVVIDTSRHMRRVLELDLERRLVKVEPGLVRDALIDFLKPHGYFFPPHVTTTSRATIGGMVSNDSSGKGSLIYGKTSHHIEALEVILPDGREMEITARSSADTNDPFVRGLSDIIAPHHDEIDRVFPRLTREFTGYNLQGARERNGTLHLTRLIAGSEGTLCLIKSVTCRITPLPTHSVLVAVRYASHEAGLRAVPNLLVAQPSAIEFIDGTILAMAEESSFAADMRKVLGSKPGDKKPGAVHFVEFVANGQEELEQRLDGFLLQLKAHAGEPGAAIGWRVAREADEIARIWAMRRACQGLLKSLENGKKAVAFVEDCVVPPENLADFVSDLQKTLQERNIEVGMYGHADVGCVHVRPALDLTSEGHRRQVREISDAVFALTQKYGGLLWGEHGKGLRSEFSEKVLGPHVFGLMCEVKHHFDPDNRMNPGKVAVPSGAGEKIIRLDAVPLRGHFEQQIDPGLRQAFANAVRCNGNGACFNLDRATPLCPSYKATGDRRYSPKGRAEVLREWIRVRSVDDCDDKELEAMSRDVFGVMSTCLSCKSCSGPGCLFRIDVPTMRSRFLEWYYQRNVRPLSDRVVAGLEWIAPVLARAPRLVNSIQSLRAVRALAAQTLRLVDLPELSVSRLRDGLKKLGVREMPVNAILSLSEKARENLVVVVQDCFTSFYDTKTALAQIELVKALGYQPVVLSYRQGGKPLHVQGFLRRFDRIARKNATDFAALAAAQLPLVGVDVATTLMYRHEYEEVDALGGSFRVLLLSEWLSGIELPRVTSDHEYMLLQHCTEKSLHPQTTGQWISIFENMGLRVDVVESGCCGMAGLFGHEEANQGISRTLYDQSWRDVVEQAEEGKILATGYSCRSQAKRMSHVRPKSPAETLLDAVQHARVAD